MLKPGEIALGFDPANTPDAGIVFIGHMETPWSKGHCPKNPREARERGGTFIAWIAEPYRAGLIGLEAGMTVILLYWMGRAARDVLVQTPASKPAPTGVFALRSPARPNPVALAITQIRAIDAKAGRIEVDASDAFNGTPIVDIKPWLPKIDTLHDGE